MKKNIFYVLAVVSLAATACGKENPEPDGGQAGGEAVPHTFKAAIAEKFSTRTSLDGMTVSWSEGDKIELYTASGTYEYTLQDSEGTFRSETTPEGEVLHAAYPAENAIWSAAGLTVTLPSEIAYGTSVIPLYAEVGKLASEISSIDMGIPVGLINLNCTDVPPGYNRLTVTSVGSRLSGTFLMENGVLHTLGTDTENVTAVTFGTLTSGQDMSFYIPAPVGTYSSVTFKLTGENVEDMMVAGLADQTIEKGIVYSLTTRSDLTIEFGDIPETDLTFPYTGGSRDYPVRSNTDWTVVSGNPEITAVKKDAGTVTVTVPAGKYVGGLSADITISSSDPEIIVAPDVITVGQEPNPALSVVDGSDVRYNADGSATLSIYPEADGAAQVSKSYFAAVDKTKYGTYTFDFAGLDMSCGIFSMECWFTSGNIQLQMGFYNRIYFSDSISGVAAQSYNFDPVSYADMNQSKQIVVKMFPSTNPELGPETDNDMTFRFYIDGSLYREQSLGCNVWSLDEAQRGGTNVNFGIKGFPADETLVKSSITIRSYTYSSEY